MSFEYKVGVLPILKEQEKLNEAGKVGWELVAVRPARQLDVDEQYDYKAFQVYYFKCENKENKEN